MLAFGFHLSLSRIFNLDIRSLRKKKKRKVSEVVNLYIRLKDLQGVSVRANVRISKLASEV